MPAYNCGNCIGEHRNLVNPGMEKQNLLWMAVPLTTQPKLSLAIKIDKRVRYFTLSGNSGAVARTRAMRIATGRYIAFLTVTICGI